MLDKKNALDDKKLEDVNGGHEDDVYGHSYTGSESETIPSGTKVIYTDTRGDYSPHYATYVRYAGHDCIVLSPDDQECKDFFEELNKIESSNMNHKVSDGYEIFYAWNTYGILMKPFYLLPFIV